MTTLTIKIGSSVGRGGTNRAEDVATVQELLNLAGPGNGEPLSTDGTVGPKTIVAIETFQSRILRMAKPDGRVDPGGRTFDALVDAARPELSTRTRLPVPCQAKGVTDADYDAVAKALGCETAAIKAVADVEAKGDGFFRSGRPKILFEAHHFSKRTARKFDRVHPGISSPSWNKALYASGEGEYGRLARAMMLDRTAALQSASWGRFQIMGFNHALAGHPTVNAFVDAMHKSESAHLEAFGAFLRSTGLAEPLKKKDWAKFAKGYNGPAYADNKYDTKMEQAYAKYKPAKAPQK